MKPAVPDPPEISHRLWEGFSGKVAWDIGANCGQTIPILRDNFERVIAFEPAVECWPYLNDFDGLTWFPIAVSDADATVDLVALPDKIETGQLVTPGTVGMEWDPRDQRAVVRRVTCRTVDSLTETVPAPDFLKIDVEGHEIRVLHGARKTLSIIRPDLLIEFHAPGLHDGVIDLLTAFGYDTETVRHPHYPPGSDMYSQHGWIRARCS